MKRAWAKWQKRSGKMPFGLSSHARGQYRGFGAAAGQPPQARRFGSASRSHREQVWITRQQVVARIQAIGEMNSQET